MISMSPKWLTRPSWAPKSEPGFALASPGSDRTRRLDEPLDVRIDRLHLLLDERHPALENRNGLVVASFVEETTEGFDRRFECETRRDPEDRNENDGDSHEHGEEGRQVDGRIS